MGSNKEKTDSIGSDYKEFRYETLKKSIALFGAFLVSLAGGFTITWWRYKYHPDNRQLWMVPVGLLLLVTPAIAWFSLAFSDIFTLNKASDQDMISREAQSGLSSRDYSIPADPERLSSKA